MSESIALQVIVFDFADAFDSQRLPRQIFARAPTALAARHPRRLIASRLGPIAPWMLIERVIAQRFELERQFPPARHRERRRDADVMECAALVVQTEQQRSNQLVLPLFVPPETGDHTVRGARVLDLDHGALAGLVCASLEVSRSRRRGRRPRSVAAIRLRRAASRVIGVR